MVALAVQRPVAGTVTWRQRATGGVLTVTVTGADRVMASKSSVAPAVKV